MLSSARKALTFCAPGYWIHTRELPWEGHLKWTESRDLEVGAAVSGGFIPKASQVGEERCACWIPSIELGWYSFWRCPYQILGWKGGRQRPQKASQTRTRFCRLRATVQELPFYGPWEILLTAGAPLGLLACSVWITPSHWGTMEQMEERSSVGGLIQRITLPLPHFLLSPHKKPFVPYTKRAEGERTPIIDAPKFCFKRPASNVQDRKMLSCCSVHVVDSRKSGVKVE